jgi:uncharacterized phiE125 gp8 family phage protein
MMAMSLKLVTTPTDWPVTLAEAKAHLRVDFADDDALIEIFRKAATDEAEKFTGRALIEQTWDLYLDEFPDDEIEIPRPPLIEIVGVYYRDSAGTEQTMDASGYVVDDAKEPARITLAYGGSWPTPQTRANAVRVRFKAGYIDDASPAAANVPFAIKAAILLTIGTLYANRETVVVGQSVAILPWGAEQLLRRYRVEKAMA